MSSLGSPLETDLADHCQPDMVETNQICNLVYLQNVSVVVWQVLCRFVSLFGVLVIDVFT